MDNKTIIISTQIVSDVEAVCDNIIVIKDGEKICQGNGNQIKSLAENKVYLIPENFEDKIGTECFIKDSLHQVCRVIGQADELVIVTKNLYGSYSTAVKNVLDRSIGTSTPFSTYRGGQMHHTLRYGRHDRWKVIVYGEISDAEKDTFRLMAQRNAINDGFERSEVIFLNDLSELEANL